MQPMARSFAAVSEGFDALEHQAKPLSFGRL